MLASPTPGSGVGCSRDCVAPGGAPAAMARNQAWWSSTVAPAAQRPAVSSAASRSMSRSTSTVSRWRSMSRRRTATTRKPPSRFCAHSPRLASRVRRWVISATGANAWLKQVRHLASVSRPLRAAEKDSSFPPASAGWLNARSRGRLRGTCLVSRGSVCDGRRWHGAGEPVLASGCVPVPEMGPRRLSPSGLNGM